MRLHKRLNFAVIIITIALCGCSRRLTRTAASISSAVSSHSVASVSLPSLSFPSASLDSIHVNVLGVNRDSSAIILQFVRDSVPFETAIFVAPASIDCSVSASSVVQSKVDTMQYYGKENKEVSMPRWLFYSLLLLFVISIMFCSLKLMMK